MKSFNLLPALLFVLSAHAVDYALIGQRIWLNESGGNPEKLVFWNPKEEFPSLGIGHFIWYPKNYQGPFVQVFPEYIAYCKEKGIACPAWLYTASAAPWNSREEFLADANSKRVKELRAFLERTVDAQAQFMVDRMGQLFEQIMMAVEREKRPQIKKWFGIFYKDWQGLYALVDYTNFKGAGVVESERYNGCGWGLLQVLQDMRPASDKVEDLLNSFADSAQKMLERRVANAPAGRNEGQFLPGWLKRVGTYRASP